MLNMKRKSNMFPDRENCGQIMQMLQKFYSNGSWSNSLPEWVETI